MDLTEVELFGTLMQTGTATETARVLGISQPGVSARLKRMESRLGMSLFDRSGRRLQPTAEALVLYADAREVFESHRRLMERSHALRVQAARPAGISATPAIIDGFLASALATTGYVGWLEELSIRVTDPEDDVEAGLSDLGLQLAFPAPADFHSERLMPVPLFAVLQCHNPLAAAADLDIGALSGEPLVCYDSEWSPLGGAIRKAWERAGHHYAPRCKVPFCSTVCQLIAACGGVGFVDAFTARGSWPGLAFKRVRDMPDVALVMFHRRDRPMRASVRRIAAALRETAREATALYPR